MFGDSGEKLEVEASRTIAAPWLLWVQAAKLVAGPAASPLSGTGGLACCHAGNMFILMVDVIAEPAAMHVSKWLIFGIDARTLKRLGTSVALTFLTPWDYTWCPPGCVPLLVGTSEGTPFFCFMAAGVGNQFQIRSGDDTCRRAGGAECDRDACRREGSGVEAVG